jgi:hypothetical protein
LEAARQALGELIIKMVTGQMVEPPRGVTGICSYLLLLFTSRHRGEERKVSRYQSTNVFKKEIENGGEKIN